jgi:hypothetical protein
VPKAVVVERLDDGAVAAGAVVEAALCCIGDRL